MALTIRMRPAESGDLEAMIDVFNDAYSDGKWHNRCFPASDPATAPGNAMYIGSGLTDPESQVVLAEDTSSGAPVLVGWARWIRRPQAQPTPVPVLKEDMFPQTGDPELAVRFITTTADATNRHTAGRPFWGLNTIVVRKGHQRKGIGASLMRFGLDKADEDGWMAFLNALPEGEALYKRFGFRTLETIDFGHGITSSPMEREARRRQGTGN
ncbi:acetyltransferase (GNAT) family domain-containing protein [Purpureocillium lavendulum]|uniref:Acetyltransferase (GNAT) family domain-containing protein n=1 Tax=Purpureocillium lavendulum TaxID=1247861 RepID=A0AB34G4V6_9HYPO|nr:acetyltransferase (GNAT) family domain-containing protein [Purpureocillium lavendulum]